MYVGIHYLEWYDSGHLKPQSLGLRMVKSQWTTRHGSSATAILLLLVQ
jgi:hypothetical protein